MDVAPGVDLGIGADDIGTGIAIDLGEDIATGTATDTATGIATDTATETATDIGTDIGTGIDTEIATDIGSLIGTVPGDLSLMGSDGVVWMGSCGKWPLEAALPGAGPDPRPDSLYGSIARRFSYSSPRLPEPVRTRP